jgi:hypothetical protein
MNGAAIRNFFGARIGIVHVAMCGRLYNTVS